MFRRQCKDDPDNATIVCPIKVILNILRDEVSFLSFLHFKGHHRCVSFN